MSYQIASIIRNFELDRNCDLVKSWTMYPGTMLYVTPVDLTSCSGVINIYSDPSLRTSLLSLSSLSPGVNGSVNLGGVAGTLGFSALKPSTLLFGPGSFPFVWYHTWADGTTIKLMSGNWIIRP